MKNDKYKDVVFGYMDVPSYGWFGEDDGGFGIFIYPNGKLVYRRYIFDCKIKKEKIYKISKASVDKISKIISSYDDKIKDFDDNLDNGSCDGDGNIFIYFEKEYITWNIERNDISKIKKNNPEYYEKYLSVMLQENLMLLIFDEIRKILLNQGVVLSLYKIKILRKGLESYEAS